MYQRLFRLALVAGCVGTGAAHVASAEEIPYVESFALAPDRQVVLQQLIPGTDDYYYYHCLHYQHTQRFAQVDEMLPGWVERHGTNERVRQIMHRQALLTYDRNPQKALEYLRRTLDLRFDHQREVTDQPPDLPTQLDPQAIARDVLTQRALAAYADLQGFDDAALQWLVEQPLDPVRRRNLLQRLQRPDYANVPQLVVDDLKAGAGFGDYGLHAQLLLGQLDECAKIEPGLLGNAQFVNIYLSKLRPAAGIDWSADAEARGQYLDRLWAFAEKLPPAFNSLKANILYHRLVHDRAQGVHDRARFLAYLQLPRNVGYIRPEFLEQHARTGNVVDLNADYLAVTQLRPIGTDEPLVRAYLLHFFVDDTSYRPFTPYVQEEYLRRVFAEAKIVNGLGDAQQWVSWLPPAEYQALKERVDLDFAPTNAQVVGATEPVRLDVFVKNVSTLIVRVFEINTTNYYRDNGREIDTDINLDGLTPNWEYTHQYDDAPLRRIKRHFEFPELNRRGVYVVDLIGNGRSSRALLRKGRLRYLMRHSTAGQILTVLDEQNHLVPGSSALLGGQLYTASQQGEIAIPFSTAPGPQPIILTHEGFSTLEQLVHAAESYSLVAGIHIDRESLLRSRKAQIVVRPGLYVNGTPVTLSVLEKIRLRIVSTDLEGVQSSQEIADFALHEDQASVHEIQVPPRLAQLDVTLLAQVQSLSENKKLDLAAAASFPVNGIDRTENTEELHLARSGAGYVLELLGKTGEPKPDRPVSISLKHRDFRDPVQVLLKTDGAGRAQLGSLPDITSATATVPSGTAYSWPLVADRQTYTQGVNGVSGQPLELPYPGGTSETAARADYSLLELRDGSFVADRFDALSVTAGGIRIQGLPPGDYDLWLKQRGARIRLQVGEGEVRNGYVLGKNRLLEIRQTEPPQIADVKVEESGLRLQVRHATPFTRVHVFASRYLPQFDEFATFAAVRDMEPQWLFVPTAQSSFVEGRNIGDEYRYIIDRKFAPKLPGNMLARPELLLNPWPVRETATSVQQAAAGEEFAPSEPPAAAARPGAAEAGGALAPAGGLWNLDFLADGAAVRVNLPLDESGALLIPRADLGPHGLVRVVVTDPVSVASRIVTLPDPPRRVLDLRLAKALDTQKHLLQQKRVSVVRSGEQFVVDDVTSSRFETFDSLRKAYNYFRTLLPDSRLQEFGFLVDWHTFDAVKKQENYSKYACHELNFFLYQRDREFFDNVVRPYLRNKREKQFLDHWLLGDELRLYAEPWRYAQLNTVERVLLTQRLSESPLIAQELSNRLDLTPPDLARLAMLFDTAVGASALETKAGDVMLGEALGALAKAPPAADSYNAMGRVDAAPAAPGAMLPMAAPEAEKMLEDLAAVADDKQALGVELRRKAADRAGGFFFRDAAKREEYKRLFQPLDKTQEWAENHYYHLPLEQQTPDLVVPSRFWLDFARTASEQRLLSTHFAEASRTFSEIMFVLALLDLPAQAPQHELQIAEGRLTLKAAGPLLVFHEEVRDTPVSEAATSLLVSQNFFRQSDRYDMVGGQQVDKFVKDEFLVHTVYGCQVVVTNPTSSSQQIDVLVQVPQGALPLAGGRYTRSVRLQLNAFSTQTLEYLFYFPAPGDFAHYPVHVGREEQVVAFAPGLRFRVVERLSGEDKASWNYVSQQGTAEEVLAYLRDRNLFNIVLERIAWRLKDAKFFRRVIDELARRKAYNHVLWSYGIQHNDVPAIREFLQHNDAFVAACGPYLDTPLLTIDPVARRSYEQLEYKPLVNARAHRLSAKREILNDRFFQQYLRLMQILACRRELNDDDLLAVTYYLLLQDRIDEARTFFARVRPDSLATRLQYDYCDAYLDFFQDNPTRAREIVSRYANHPVDRWRNAFAAILAQLAEIEGGKSGVVDPLDRDQAQAQLAAAAPTLDLKIVGQDVVLAYENLNEVVLNFYEMDIELLFSRNPFVQQFSGQFSYIRPNVTRRVMLPAGQPTLTVPLPEELRKRNVLVEAVGGGQTKTQAYYSSSLVVQVSENYGQLRVLDAATNRPLPKVYVKVYARMNGGTVEFFKDGYTDLRGRFDYASLSTNQLDNVERFAVLVLSDAYGASVREVAPPKR